MTQFYKKLGKYYPVSKAEYEALENGIIKHNVILSNRSRNLEGYQSIPYVEELKDFLKVRKGGVQKRTLLVTDNEKIAVKAALLLKEFADDFVTENGDKEILYDIFGAPYEEEDIYGMEPDGEEGVRIISLKKPITNDKVGVNRYISFLSAVNKKDTILFTGSGFGGNTEEKLEVIGACLAETQFVHITKDEWKLPWVQELCIRFGCDQLVLQEPEASYYVEVVKTLLEGERYKLAKELSVERLVHRIRKKRGCNLQEEDLAWYLEEAVQTAVKQHPRTKVLKEEDFSMLFAKDLNPMEQLEGMTGLQEVKEMAKEFAAIVKEELLNPKLGTLHKNMIFLGNPGTGKTTCAGILAQLMAEEGHSNGNFVVATRKDLIGEYVGQTAPKVAARFAEARGGILFVDEAGFFLNTSAGGFVQEATKEFIRYMETYPDVTVIFGMYASEARAFLEIDAGMASRISRFVNFADYTDEELCDILKGMLEEKGYMLEADAQQVVKAYMHQLRKERRKNFGNAREARKLAESAIIAACVRKQQEQTIKSQKDACITVEDIKKGKKRLMQEAVKKQEMFGFGCVEAANKVQHCGA